MRIFRARNGLGIDLIKDFLQFNPRTVNHEALVSTYKQWMEQVSDFVFLAIALDGTEVKGFALATVSIHQSFVFLHQAWLKPMNDPTLADRLFYRLCMWAEENGKSEIRTETPRSTDSLHRRWNFEELAVVMKFSIPPGLDESLVAGNHLKLVGKTEEVEDGK